MAQEKDILAKLSLDELTDLYNQYRHDTSDEGARMRSRLWSKLRRLSHADIHPDEEYFHVDVPRSVTGEIFTINEEQFLGPCEVPACQLQTLLHMVYQNRLIDQERMRDNGRTLDLGAIGERISNIQRE